MFLFLLYLLVKNVLGTKFGGSLPPNPPRGYGPKRIRMKKRLSPFGVLRWEVAATQLCVRCQIDLVVRLGNMLVAMQTVQRKIAADRGALFVAVILQTPGPEKSTFAVHCLLSVAM